MTNLNLPAVLEAPVPDCQFVKEDKAFSAVWTAGMKCVTIEFALFFGNLLFTLSELMNLLLCFIFLKCLCISESFTYILKTLPFCHVLYHACLKNPVRTDESGTPRSLQIVQKRASEICNYVMHLI
jgi:hypothetical protein